MYRVFVVSDGTGATAEQVLQAALTQFSHADVIVERRPEIRTEAQIQEVVAEAARSHGFIIHTLVSDRLREVIFHTGRTYNVETIDLMGPLLARLSDQLGTSPAEHPGIFRQLNDEYFRRIETMEFALRHDDGQRIHELEKAEIVLVGVSRTFKTPLSIYLAFRGWFTANVPIVPAVRPPAALFSLPPGKVCGLTMDPLHLAKLRQIRETYLGGAVGDYADPESVRREVEYALSIFRGQRDWPVVDVTNKPIEETAAEILASLGRRRS
ncbi:MAG TPA: kinase/pyrophosphorylase [Chloroflexi bacterium]|nr:kinase/pyrophosphorylase [Chloroflexota bacterium]